MRLNPLGPAVGQLPKERNRDKRLAMPLYRNDVQQTGPDVTAKVHIAVRSTAPLGNKSLVKQSALARFLSPK